MITRRLFLAAAALPAPAFAQQPTLPRTVTLVVPFGAGTVVDIMARAFAEPFRQALGGGITVVVLNREGAGGSIAAASIAQARPDGATIAFGPSGMMTVQPVLLPTLPYRLDAFEPICQNFENIFALAVPANSPHNDLRAFLAAARARPDTLSFGHSGNGTVPHLIGRQLELLADVRLSDVAYRSGGQMMTEVRGGTLDMAITTWATIRESGLKVLAVVADARDPAVGEVPTLSELGYPVTWRGFGGLWGPRGLPPSLVERFEAACLEATASDGYRTVMTSTAQVVAPLARAPFAERLAAEHREAQTMLRSLGLIPR
jgi:tripartite-type tricarboxylate transporter receptor subunit TctC